MKNIRPILITAVFVAVALAVIMKVLYPSAFDANRVVAVSQIVEHPALDAVRQGILDGLAEKGFKDGENLTFKFQTAQGNPAVAAQIRSARKKPMRIHRHKPPPRLMHNCKPKKARPPRK